MSQANSVKEVLIAARWIIDNVGWCQQSYLKDKNGEAYNYYTLKSVKGVDCVCSLGAVFLVEADESLLEQAEMLLRQAGIQAGESGIISFNDKEGRTKEEVLDLFDTIIKDLP